MEERSVDKLSRYIMWTAAAVIIGAICWYFRSVLVYVIVAAVISFVGRPVMKGLDKLRIRGRRLLPLWLQAILTMVIIILLLIGLFTQIIPMVMSIISTVSANFDSVTLNVSEITAWLEKANVWIIDRIPSLGRDFKLQDAVGDWATKLLDTSKLTTMVGSVASTVGSIGVGLFSAFFISFFFLKDENLFRKIIGSLVSDKFESNAINAVGDIEVLLTRYFVGIVTEIIGVAILTFIGFWLVCGINFGPALGIAFMTGLFNMIPYVGPWIGGALGCTLGIVLKYSTIFAAGAAMPNFLVVLVTFIAVIAVVQFIDNTLFQPLIYSKSIKSSPLEIFIVLLMAGHIGGILGMFLAIPAYTVIRVIAIRFFGNVKFIQRLMGSSGEASDAAAPESAAEPAPAGQSSETNEDARTEDNGE